MPREYEAIRDAILRRGKSAKTAKRIAAATYNQRHPHAPMGPHSDTNAAVRAALQRKHR